MTDELGTAESQAANMFVLNAVKLKAAPRAVKAKTSKRKTKETEAIEEPPPSEHMTKVKKRRKRNKERIKTISEELKGSLQD